MQRSWNLTEAELAAVPDEELVQKVIYAVLSFVGSPAPDEDDHELVRQAPKSAQFLWAMHLLESEVNNGGFEQYFWNSSSTLAGVAVEAYRAIGADKYVDLVQRALTMVGNESWLTRRRSFDGDWRAYRKACTPALDALDNEFYAARCGSPGSGGEDASLHKRKVEYIRRNAKAICCP